MSDDSSWYYVAEDEGGRRQEGPVSADEVRALLSDGRVTPDTFVWSEGMSEWVPLGTLPAFVPAAPEEGAALEVEGAAEAAEAAGVEAVEEDVAAPAPLEYAEEAPGLEEQAAAQVDEEPAAAPEAAAEPEPEPEAEAPTREIAPGVLPDTVTLRELPGYTVDFAKARGVLLISNTDPHAGPLPLRKLDLIELLRDMESASQEG